MRQAWQESGGDGAKDGLIDGVFNIIPQDKAEVVNVMYKLMYLEERAGV